MSTAIAFVHCDSVELLPYQYILSLLIFFVNTLLKWVKTVTSTIAIETTIETMNGGLKSVSDKNGVKPHCHDFSTSSTDTFSSNDSDASLNNLS